MIQKVMGFRYSATLEFDNMDLSDENAEKALIIQLADRNIVSNEFVQKRFGAHPELENVRVARENAAEEKLTPYSSQEDSLRKVALQLGIATPGQVDLPLGAKNNGEKTLLELKKDFAPTKKIQKTGVSGEGRPKNSKDTQPRKTKKFAPQTGASLVVKGIGLQDEISKIVNPVFLEFYEKKNMRSLSQSEYETTENVKTSIVFNIDSKDKITSKLIQDKIKISQSDKVINKYHTFSKKIKSQIDKDLTTDDYKQLKAYFYSMVYA